MPWSLSLVRSLLATLATREKVGEFCHLLEKAIIAESAIVVWKNCVERNRDFRSLPRSLYEYVQLFIDSYVLSAYTVVIFSCNGSI